MKKRILTAKEQLEMLSPWMITAAPPAFDKVYDDDNNFLRRERPLNFPELTPAPETDELTEPPAQAPRVKNPVQLKMFPNSDFKKVRPTNEKAPGGKKPQESFIPPGNMNEDLTSGGVRPYTDMGQMGRDYEQLGDGGAEQKSKNKPVKSGDQPVLSPEEPSKGGAPKDPEWESLSSNLARFLVPEELERSLIDKYNASDAGTREAGGQWYDTANEYIHNLAQKSGLDPAKVGAIVSAFSPQTSWDANMAAANYFIMNYDPNNPDAINDKMGGLTENLERAKRIHAADDEDGYLAGLQNGNDAHKITNFYHNLMGSKDHVTIDSWMARALLGKGADGLADKSVQKVLGWKDGYDIMANSVRSAAQKLGVSPRELQAIVWSQVVPTAGSYEELSPEQYAKQKKQKENYIDKAPEDAKLLPDYFHGPAWESRPEPTYRNKVSPNTANPRWGQRLWHGGIQDDKYPQHWMDKAEQLARDTGGFTIHDDPSIPGDAPSSGYQVAIPGYERTDINTGQGWADFAHEINPVLRGENTGLGTWRNDEDGLYYTEPSERFHDYDQGARATLDRNQWAMWDNGAFTVDPQTGEKNFLDQATIPRTDIAQQGIANSTGFTLAKNRGITYRPTALKCAKRFWEG